MKISTNKLDRIIRRMQGQQMRVALVTILSTGNFSVTTDTLNRLVHLINKIIGWYEECEISHHVAFHQFKRLNRILSRKILVENISQN